MTVPLQPRFVPESERRSPDRPVLLHGKHQRADQEIGVPAAHAHASASVPVISKPLLRWFTWYSRRYLRRHFHSLRVSLNGLPPGDAQLPLVIYSNHAAWWDALVGLVLKAEFFSSRQAFAPIDSKALENYKMFGRLGFFGVEQGTRRGAVQFLRTSEHILRAANSLLVVTPQGRFADVRERPIRFEAGLGHLATRVEHAVFLPMATEFVFWEERLPEILVRFGEPVEVSAQHAVAFDAKYWTALFEEKWRRRRTRSPLKPSFATRMNFKSCCAAARDKAASTIGGAR